MIFFTAKKCITIKNTPKISKIIPKIQPNVSLLAY